MVDPDGQIGMLVDVPTEVNVFIRFLYTWTVALEFNVEKAPGFPLVYTHIS